MLRERCISKADMAATGVCTRGHIEK
jgi:hypothetical protein